MSDGQKIFQKSIVVLLGEEPILMITLNTSPFVPSPKKDLKTSVACLHFAQQSIEPPENAGPLSQCESPCMAFNCRMAQVQMFTYLP